MEIGKFEKKNGKKAWLFLEPSYFSFEEPACTVRYKNGEKSKSFSSIPEARLFLSEKGYEEIEITNNEDTIDFDLQDDDEPYLPL